MKPIPIEIHLPSVQTNALCEELCSRFSGLIVFGERKLMTPDTRKQNNPEYFLYCRNSATHAMGLLEMAEQMVTANFIMPTLEQLQNRQTDDDPSH